MYLILFVNLPKGLGKSLIYQALPLVFDRVFDPHQGYKYMFENIAEQNGLTVLNKTMRCPIGSNYIARNLGQNGGRACAIRR